MIAANQQRGVTLGVSYPEEVQSLWLLALGGVTSAQTSELMERLALRDMAENPLALEPALKDNPVPAFIVWGDEVPQPV